MAKGKRRRAKGAATDARLAERHDWTGGYLGHEPGQYLVNVSEQTALGVDAVYSCVRTLADAVAGSDVGEWRDTERLQLSRLARRPMATWTRRRWLWRVTATLALYNVCHLERVGEDAEGVALSLVPLRPGQLTKIGDRLYIDGEREVAEADIRTIVRADWPSVTLELGTVLRLARDTFAASWAAQAYTADFWAQGGAPQIVLVSDQDINDADAELIADRWVSRRKESPGKPAVMSKGARAETLGIDAAKAGAGAASDRLASSIARYFGVPSWIVNVPQAAGSLTYSNTESAGLDLVRYTLDGYIGPIGDELSDELPADYIMGRRIVIDPSRLTQGTMLERFQAYAIATGDRPWMTPAEVRSAVNLPPDRALDELGAPAPPMEQIPVATRDAWRAWAAARRDAPMRTLEIAGELAVREAVADGRTIEGIAVPYGRPTLAGHTQEWGPGIREMFAPGSFAGVIAERAGRPIPILDRHQGAVIGSATEYWEAPDGLHVRGRLLDTQAARDWVAQARPAAEGGAGVNGVSIEFGFGTIRRRARDLVEHVRVSALGAIAASYAPAYAGAGLSVREVYTVDRCEHCGVELVAGVEHVCENPQAGAPAQAPASAPQGVAPAAGAPAARQATFPGVTAGPIPLTNEAIARLAMDTANEAVRRHLEGRGGRGTTDAWADVRGFRSLGELMFAAAAPDATTEIRSYAARALADQLTTDNNAGVTTPGVLQEVRGIIDRGRPAITAFGGPRDLGEVGMSVDWPYFDGTLSALVGVQAAQKTEITSAKVEIKKGTEAILTYAGGSDIAYQLIRRSSPAYLDIYGRILLAAWGLVTDAAFVTELETGTVTQDLAEAITAVDSAELWAALVAASVAVDLATGQPAAFGLAGTAAFTQAAKVLPPSTASQLPGTTDLRGLRVVVGNLPIIHVPAVTTGKIIVSNEMAAGWHESGPFQASEEDVAKLGRNVAYWSMGAGARYLPAGIVEIYDVSP